MTDPEIKLEILKALIPIASRHGIERAELITKAQDFFDFVKQPAKDSTDTPAKDLKKK